VEQAIGPLPDDVFVIPSHSSAAASAAAALTSGCSAHPVLLTTADHVLLDAAMLDHFLEGSTAAAADLTVGLARAETILAAYPATRRTFLRFGPDRVSGCNLFGLMSPRAARRWRSGRTWSATASGHGVLSPPSEWDRCCAMALGRIDLVTAFQLGSRRLGLEARPIIMPFAEAAIDVDKPDDKVVRVDPEIARIGRP
jgi:hypothetical protein